MKFTKDFLLSTLRSNRQKHRAIFEEAVEGYRFEALKACNEFANRLKDGELLVVWAQKLVVPFDHTEDYDVVISMLENTMDDSFEIDQVKYQSYVMDKWNWQTEFLASNSTYSATAARALKKF